MNTPRIASAAHERVNGHARSPRARIHQLTLAAGGRAHRDWQSDHPRAPLTLTGFVDAMQASGPWQPVPLYCAMVGASGPVEQRFFEEIVREHEVRLRAAMPVDGVFLSLHGGAIGEREGDPKA